MIIHKITDKKSVDLKRLSIQELYELHYELETCYVKLIKKTEPFSSERNRLMKETYSTVTKIIKERKFKESSHLDDHSYGAKDIYIRLIEDVIHNFLKTEKQCNFFEAGIGTGKVIKSISNMERVHCKGCDIYVDEGFIDDRLNVIEGTIFDVMETLNDEWIDIFYWNDVMEHIPSDEIDGHIKLIYRKMSPGGMIITATPNRLGGPYDITAKFKPKGSKAIGTHFHEYTYSEISDLFREHGFKVKYGVWHGLKGVILKQYSLYKLAKISDSIKWIAEKMLLKMPRIPWFVRKVILRYCACNVSVFGKE